MALTAFVLLTSSVSAQQASCHAAHARLRDGEPCIPFQLVAYLYCLRQSGDGKIEVIRRQDITISRSLEVKIAGKASGVVLQSGAQGGVNQVEVTRVLQQLNEKLDPSLTRNCKDLAAGQGVLESRELKKLAGALVESNARVESLRQDNNQIMLTLTNVLQRVQALEERGNSPGIVRQLLETGRSDRLIPVLVAERDKSRNDLLERNREISLVAYLQHDMHAAIAATSEILRLQPDDLDALIIQSNALWLTGAGKATMEQTFTKILEVAMKAHDLEAQAGALANLGELYWGGSGRFPPRALEMFRKAKELEKQSAASRGIPYYDPLPEHLPPLVKGNLIEFERYYNEWVSGKRRDSTDRIAAAYGFIGVIRLKNNDLKGAEEWMLKALDLYLSIPLESKTVVLGRANQYANLGIVFAGRQDNVRAKEYWIKSREIYASQDAEIARQLTQWILRIDKPR